MSIDNFNNIHSSNGVGLHTDIHSTNRIGLHEQKLNGELPVTREELIELIKSWGEIDSFNESIKNVGSCYDLSRLDVSQITDMSYLFQDSPFDGDISNWNTSNVTSMESMFSRATNFNQPLNFNTSKVTNMLGMFNNAITFNQPLNFNTSKVTSMISMFSYARVFNQPINFDTSKVISMYEMFNGSKSFNQNISNWKLDSIIYATNMFLDVKAFINRYNSGKTLPNETDSIKEWLNNNRDRMNDIDTKNKYGKEIDNFFSNITDIYSTNRIGLHENLLTECNKSSNRMQQAICL